MGRKKASLVKAPTNQSIQPASVPTDEVKFKDVSVPETPATTVSAMVQQSVDGGASAADATAQGFVQGYADRLTQNMPVALGQMGVITEALFGSVVNAFEQACDMPESGAIEGDDTFRQLPESDEEATDGEGQA